MKLHFYITISILTVFLTACESVPKFQKADSGLGYRIEELSTKDSFKIVVPEYSLTSYRIKYAFRATGEECLARGFEYFDFSYQNLDFHGFCYPTATSKSLAIAFSTSELDKNPPRFIVESLNGKTLTKLELGDEILTMADQPLRSMWQAKYLVFSANSEKTNHMRLRVKRGQKELTLSEPLASFSGYLTGKEGLEALRKSVQ